MILGNKYRHLVGHRVTAVEEIHQGQDITVPVGSTGTIHDVESHGNNPWTRFGITWDDGTRCWGVNPAKVEVEA